MPGISCSTWQRQRCRLGVGGVLSRPWLRPTIDCLHGGGTAACAAPEPVYSNRPMIAASAIATTPAAIAAQRIAFANAPFRFNRDDPNRRKRMLALGRSLRRVRHGEAACCLAATGAACRAGTARPASSR